MSAIEVFANSKADHGLAPLEVGRVYVSVFCTTWVTKAAEFLAADYFGGTTALVDDVGDVPSAGIPVRGSAKVLLSVRTGSIG